MVVLPIAWGTLGTVVSSPFALAIFTGILNAIFLMGVAISTIYLTRTQTDPRVKDGLPFTVMLIISAIAIIGVGVIGLINSF